MLIRKHSSVRAILAAFVAIASLAVFALASTFAGAHGMTDKSHPAPKNMKISIKVKKDRMAGYNLFVATRKFRWAPEHASGKHVQGEGHAHLMIDGEKVTRLYGSAYFLGNMKSGKHKVTVDLNGNDHVPYVRNGKSIAATVTVDVP